MLTASLIPANNLNDPLSTSSKSNVLKKSMLKSSSSNRQILFINQETDHISSTQEYESLGRFVFENNTYNSRLNKNGIKTMSIDVLDNKTDHFLTPTFCNIKRMTEIYCNEVERLKTFQNWPLAYMDKHILAKTGFFFTGDDDKVKCYFCEVEIGRWEPTDNAVSEHTRWSPNCPLLRRRATNNVPIDEESLNCILPQVSYDVCGANDIIEVRPNAYAEGSISSNSPIGSPTNSLPNTPNSVTIQTNFLYPDHPEYAVEAVRFRSFGEWPRTMKQKPEQLSEAGFFYTGTGDRVKCFSCGGGLKDWDENDDPWEQHALWLANCHYLKLMKGTDYIQAVAEKFRTAEEESKELERNENELKEEEQQQQQGIRNTPSNNSSSNNNELNEISNVASTSSTSSSLLEKTNSSNNKSEKEKTTISNKNNNNKLRHSDSSCSGCSQNSNVSDEENGSTSGSESVSSVNSNSSKEAETVCKQPKLNCHHHHISRELVKKPINVSEEKLCKICYAAEYNTAFLPCGHVVACAKCASSVTKCPMCRKPFTDVMRVYFS